MDNSVVMAWCFDDEDNGYADDILGSLEKATTKVPSIWPLEVGNVLLVAQRRLRLTEADGMRFLALLSALPIQVVQETPARMLKEILALAREMSLSTYDASYLDLAMREGLPIASQNEALLQAAGRCHVPVLK